MALDIPALEKAHLFIFAPHLVFLSEETKSHVLKNPNIPNERALFLGLCYQNELREGFIPECEIKFISDEIGHGLFAKKTYPKDTFIGSYTGVICENTSYYKMHNYLFRYPVKTTSDLYLSIDAEPYGNHTRFINHSFEPNLDHFYAFQDGLYHLIFVANRTILDGEQFTFNYGPSYWYLRGAPNFF